MLKQSLHSVKHKHQFKEEKVAIMILLSKIVSMYWLHNTLQWKEVEGAVTPFECETPVDLAIINNLFTIFFPLCMS